LRLPPDASPDARALREKPSRLLVGAEMMEEEEEAPRCRFCTMVSNCSKVSSSTIQLVPRMDPKQ
jgi:hypothetical protein